MRQTADHDGFDECGRLPFCLFTESVAADEALYKLGGLRKQYSFHRRPTNCTARAWIVRNWTRVTGMTSGRSPGVIWKPGRAQPGTYVIDISLVFLPTDRPTEPPSAAGLIVACVVCSVPLPKTARKKSHSEDATRGTCAAGVAHPSFTNVWQFHDTILRQLRPALAAHPLLALWAGNGYAVITSAIKLQKICYKTMFYLSFISLVTMPTIKHL